jgi:exonuclease SbcC
MRIRKVTAHAFGPLVSQTLEFAEGLTVVVGDNESAKSSWHAAIFAALCGRRRGRGRPREDEQRFADLHKPWDREDWLVSAEVVLDDGRRIQLRQDLAGRVDCDAVDLDVGKDVSAQVMNDGAPDAARWLGLDRSSFVATACVEQAQMLRVRSEADGLQQYLQRAAATAGTDSTAAAALELITRFDREHVGLDRANTGKPLRRALENLQDAEGHLAAARQGHQEYLRLAVRADGLRDAAQRAEAAVRAHEAAHAAHLAGELAERAVRAADLHESLGGTPPASIAEDDALGRQVAEALAAWRTRPTEPLLSGPTTDQLQQQISALPPAPQGDLEVHDSVRQALERLQRADSQLQQHDKDRPAEPTAADAIAAGDDELVDLARTLDTAPSEVDPDLASEEEAARQDLGALQASVRIANLILVAAGAAAAAGIALLASVSPVAGVVLLAAAAVLIGFGLHRRRGGRLDATMRRNADLQAALNQAKRQATEAAQRREDAVRRCAQLGVDADAQALRRMAGARARAASYSDDLRRWAERHRELEGELRSAAAGLAGALAARGHPDTSPNPDDLTAAVHAYRAACGQRSGQAAEARQREPLQARLEARQQEQQRANQDRQKRADAARLATEAATACGLAVNSPDSSARELANWSARRSAQMEQATDAQKKWTDLQSLLNGRSLEQLQNEAADAAQRAEELATGVQPELLRAANPATADQQLPALRRAARASSGEAADASGDLRRFAKSVVSVAEAEEDLEAAGAELARVQQLKEVLTLTRGYLEHAQDRVQRDIAPILAATVKRWLPAVTAGRYTDVTVNPTTLQVQVCGSSRRWRTADLLSYGTAEQVYLLLRVALADHLTRNHGTCPLILDDVTVHADSARTRDILGLLLKIAEERQVIIFTQEEQVAAWAREHLTGPGSTIHTLSPVPVS